MQLNTFEGGNILEKKRNFDNEFYRVEEDLYSGKLKTEEIINFLKDFPSDENNQNKVEAYLDFFTAIAHHNRANELFKLFNQFATNKGASLPNKQEYLKMLKEYPEAEELYKRETKAIEYYEKALRLWHHTDNKRIQEYAIATLASDLEFRQINRLAGKDEKIKFNDALESNRSDYQRIAWSAPKKGIRAELGTIAIIRDHLQKEKLDHLVHIYHALPENDHNKNIKIDIEVIFGDKIANIQVKSEANDGYQERYTGDKQTNTNVDYLIVNQKRTIEGLQNQPGKTNSETQKTFNKFKTILRQNNIKLPIKKQKNESIALSIEDIINLHCPVARLVKEKMLDSANVGLDMEVIDKAKEKFKKYLEDNPAELDRVRQEIAKEPKKSKKKKNQINKID